MKMKLALAVTLAAALAATANAQATATPQQPGVAGQPYASAQAGAGNLDQAIAACLYLGNQEEIAISQFAVDRTQDQKVRQFAEMMVRDHRQNNEKLLRVYPQLANWNLQLTGSWNNQGQGQTSGQPAAGQPGAVQGQARPGQGGDANSQILAFQRRMAEECLKLTQQELGQHTGAEFDQEYLGQQYGMHVATLAKLRASEEFASGQLKQFIQETRPVIESHFTKVKEIKKSVMEQGAAGQQAAQREQDAARR
jgi:predicted outer membrane protein